MNTEKRTKKNEAENQKGEGLGKRMRGLTSTATGTGARRITKITIVTLIPKFIPEIPCEKGRSYTSYVNYTNSRVFRAGPSEGILPAKIEAKRGAQKGSRNRSDFGNLDIFGDLWGFWRDLRGKMKR